MLSSRISEIIITVFFLTLIACSGRDSRVRPEEFLPESIASLGMERSGELMIFRGDSLSTYTNDADFFQRFHFVDMATCDYDKDDITLEMEVYHLASPEDAYGLYSHMRWGNSDKVVPLGIEGFQSPPDIIFVKGPYVVHAMGFDDSELPMQALNDLTTYFATDMPGDTAMPAGFSMFPSEGEVPSTAMYFPDLFLGLDFMKCIYGCYREMESDTVFLFMACDSAGPMLLQWSQTAEADSTYRPLPDGIVFDDGKGFMIEHPRLGRVVMGIKNDILVGMIGYDESYGQYMSDWINTLPEKSI